MTEPLLIALTGSIGVGKSSVAKFLAELGAQIVSGDDLGRRALEESPADLAAIRERFGSDVFADDGKLLRRDLGRRVFASQGDVAWLTKLTFPTIHKLWRDAVQHATSRVVIFDAALIFEWGIEGEFDLVMLVTARSDTVRQRLSHERRFTSAEWEARQRMQLADAVKSKQADVVVQNDGTMADLRIHVLQIWQNVIEPQLQKGRS